MKQIILILTIVFSTNVCFSQEEVLEDFRYVTSDQVDFDIELLALGFGYKFKLSDHWQVGPEFGFGFGLTLGHASVIGADRVKDGRSSSTAGFELLRLGVLFKYYPVKRLSIEFGPKTGVFILGISGQDGINGSGILAAITSGLGGGIYYGNNVQVGIRFSVGFWTFSDFPVFAVNTNLLTLRIPIKND